jgi:signal transduction histidine kinase
MWYLLLNPFSLFLFLTALFAFSLAAYASRSPQAHATGIVVTMVGAGIWAAADALKIGAPTASTVVFWNQVSYVGVVLVPPGVVWFAAAYTDRTYWLDFRRFGLFLAVSAVAVVVALTNESGLWRASELVTPGTMPPVIEAEFGLAHTLWNVYVLAAITPFIYALLLSEFRSNRSSLFRQQISLLLVGFSFPWIAAVLFVTDTTPVDLTPLGFTVFGTIVVVAVRNYRLLDIVPIARDIVIENLDSGIVVLDDEKRAVDANALANTILGRDNVTVGEDATTVFSEFESIVDLVQAGEEGTTTITIEREDETRHYNAGVSAISNNEHVLGMVVILSDITAQVDRERQLVERTTRLEQKNEQLDEFASIVSHDLRNPLNVAQLWTETLESDTDHEAVEKIDQSLDRMESIIMDVLELARQQELVEETESLSLEVVAQDAWDYVAAGEGKLLVADDALIEADKGRLSQLFENLYRNAIEHAGPAVTVRVEPTAGGFAVSDDGPGIDPSLREEIFETGYSTREEGTGFGLNIVERIVEAHGWEIRVTESESGGARFEIQTT